MNGYRLSKLARSDLRQIWSFVAKDRPTSADDLSESFYERFHLIARNPEVGESRPDFGSGLRLLSAGSYIIGFRPTPQRVQIVRVVHGARDLRGLFR
jgi:toxin ParE1/3/4